MQTYTPSSWLIISHGFNMDGRAASLTVTDKVPYLLKSGIRLTVLSAITGKKDARFRHYQLMPWGPSGLRFDFRHWVAVNCGRGLLYKVLTSLMSLLLLPFIALERLFVGLSSQSSWALPAAFKAIKLVRSGEVDLIYSSGGAWSAHYAAWIAKKVTGVRWIAEIHDPMVIRVSQADDGVSPRGKKDARFLQKLEGMICRDANYVWWFTNAALSYAKNRHPILGRKGFVVFPGAEPPGCHKPLPVVHVYGDYLNLCHFGSLSNDRSIAPLLNALNIFFHDVPEAKRFIRINIYGSALDGASKKAIEDLHLDESVFVYGRIEADPITGESGRERIMKLMRTSDILVGLHGNYEWCSEYIPSKLYDYFWTNRPILALTNRNLELDQLLAARGAYLSHTLENSSIVSAIRLIWDDWQKKSLRQVDFKPICPGDAVDQILKKIQANLN